MPMATDPASPFALSGFSTESHDGNFIPTYQNSNFKFPHALGQGTTQECGNIHFVEDESLAPKNSEKYAKYVEDCCRKRILNTELTKLKDNFQRPENCLALNAPTVNPTLWAQLPKEQKEHDKRLQNAQALLAKGLTGVIHVKESILQFNAHPDQFFSIFKELNEKLDASVALLGNAFLESSYRRRDLLKPAINSRFHSLCSTKTPITNYLSVTTSLRQRRQFPPHKK